MRGEARLNLLVLSQVSVLFLENAVKSHFKFTLHRFLIDFCLEALGSAKSPSIKRAGASGGNGRDRHELLPPTPHRACRDRVQLQEVLTEMATRGLARVKPCPVRTLGKPELRDVTKHRVWNQESRFLSPRSEREITW